MNGVHDMGGMENLGVIIPEPEGLPFHHAWEGRVHAMYLATAKRSNIDAARHEREKIPGPEYLAMTYYEKWFRGLAETLVAKGYATWPEIRRGEAEPGCPKATGALRAEDVTPLFMRRGWFLREAGPPRFAVGDAVRALDLNPPGHTRLPRYVRGRRGVIVSLYGAHVFPDTNAHGQGENPQPLYAVRFTAQELWGRAANPRDSVTLDLWEPYLERA